MKLKKLELNPSVNQVNQSNQSLESSSKLSPLSLTFFVIAFILGSLSGFFLARRHLPTNSSSSSNSNQPLPTSKSQIKAGQVFGSNDEKTFRDHAVGILKRGGIDGEGSHHLVRPGGPSKNVYLTSSVVDLDLFEGAKVEIWGETFGAKKAGWLMDVGRVKVLELNPSEPQE